MTCPDPNCQHAWVHVDGRPHHPCPSPTHTDGRVPLSPSASGPLSTRIGRGLTWAGMIGGLIVAPMILQAQARLVTVPARAVAPVEFALGDCALLDDIFAHPQEVVDCDEPHSAEIYHLVHLDNEANNAYPQTHDIEAFATPRCDRNFDSYSGTDQVTAGVFTSEGIPDWGEWEDGERVVACYAIDLATTPATVGSIRDGES